MFLTSSTKTTCIFLIVFCWQKPSFKTCLECFIHLYSISPHIMHQKMTVHLNSWFQAHYAPWNSINHICDSSPCMPNIDIIKLIINICTSIKYHMIAINQSINQAISCSPIQFFNQSFNHAFLCTTELLNQWLDWSINQSIDQLVDHKSLVNQNYKMSCDNCTDLLIEYFPAQILQGTLSGPLFIIIIHDYLLVILS